MFKQQKLVMPTGPTKASPAKNQAQVTAKRISNAVQTQRQILKGEILVAGSSAGGSTYTTRILKAVCQRTDHSQVIWVSVGEGTHQDEVYDGVQRAIAVIEQAMTTMGCRIPLNVAVRKD